MLPNVKSRGSECLAGAASLKHRMPTLGDCFHVPSDVAQSGRATDIGSVSRRFESCYPLQTNAAVNSIQQ